ncbi:MAG: hypothetical protein COV55_04205 [Candidatus Komeilibacteria bacterium CG11_big_fil_rev_8_21_14_0_20_36_20]|uniref:Uncharacterized protein n=1 Tax=Candidatus Komeilibacteria bacterium CG11_big_fil_rev_8_21_14_0_20_36_20 TaxID=1974477 RepID=A0A2H0NBR2_9BACT|nr:MAG: hypothetical protein COV55_04205 [Candidatus Komeilibacteria bacterium CG11_big_fil_rev_8_21_14_0_20_36_20]PIR81446.1 MAG: hypothetical protein COU21_03435 [Candidatus Komeilibacteria bacterium CG10_big_fil_rev_8_21_14_0_10_36_65]PJC55647.1 MAG: hypothetical protein CO027_00790 [Candidatus Komeilibacteria bacterium CG_4_9_14_0_2_um_filter_36_13]
MPLHKIAELVFTLVMLLFVSTVALGVLVGVTILQELSTFEVSFNIQMIFVAGMGGTFLYIMKMIIDKIKDYNRYI